MTDSAAPTASNRFTYDRRITLGNVLTIIGGMFVAASTMIGIVIAFGSLQSDVRFIIQRMNALECGLADVGILPTATPCTTAGRRSLESRR